MLKSIFASVARVSRTGIHSGLPERFARRVQINNLIYITLFLDNLITTFFYFFNGDRLIALLQIPVGIWCLIGLELNRRGKFDAAIRYTIVMGAFTVSYFDVLLGPMAKMDIAYMIVAAAPAILIGGRSLSIIFWGLLPLLNYGIIQVATHHFKLNGFVELDKESLERFHILLLPSCSIILVSAIYYLSRFSEEIESDLRETTSRFEQMADHVNSIFWIRDTESLSHVYVSPAFDIVFGFPRIRVLESKGAYLEAVLEEDRARHQAFFLQRSYLTPTASVEYRILRADGSIRWLRDRVFPVKDEQGEIYRVCGITEDFTEQKEQTEKIARSERLLSAFIDHVPANVYAKDLHDRYILSNRTHFEALGLRKEEVLGQKTDGASVLERSPLTPEQEAAHWKKHDYHGFEVKEGDRTWNVLRFPLFDDADEVFAVGSIARDITKERAIETELRASTARFRAFLDSTDEVFWLTSPTVDQIHYLSPAFEKLMGEPVGLYYQNPLVWLDRVHPDDKSYAMQAMSEGRFDVTYRLVRPDGKVRWVWVRSFPLYDESGNQEFLGGIMSDVTEKRLAEDETRAQQSLFKQVMDAISDMIVVKGENSSLLWANHAFREFAGNAEGLSALEPDERSRAESRQDTELVRLTGKIIDNPNHELIGKNGARRTFHTLKSPIYGPEGKNSMIVAVSRDITEKTRAERIISEQQARMLTASKLASLGEMAAGIAHEINTPLATASALAQQLQDIAEESQPDMKTIFDKSLKIESTMGRIAKIIKSLRALSRDGSHEPVVPESLAKVVDDATALCAERFKVHGIPLSMVGVTGEALIECRPTEISQVLLNLLNNAKDAVEDLPEKWVRVEAADVGDSMEIRVVDSGSGITPSQARRIFEPFFTTKTADRGTGLGLSIAREIAESHGGALTIDTDSPNTCFVLRLPKPKPAMRTTEGAA